MPTLSSILNKLSEHLRAHGAKMVYYPLDIISSAAAFLEATGTPLDGEIALAAFSVALLGPEEACNAAVKLGLRADLIPARGKTDFLIDIILMRMMDGDNNAQGIVGAAVFFSHYCLAAKQGDDTRLKSLRDILSFFLQRDSPQREFIRILDGEVKRINIASPIATDLETYLFSLSIDLVGSTDAKARVLRVGADDQNKINRLNLDIFTAFCRVEISLYLASTAQYGSGRPIPLDKFFTVKGIGDEIWILCNITADEVFEFGHRLIHAAIHVASQSVRFLALQRDRGPRFSREFDPGMIEPIASPVKIYVDLVKHASNVGAKRDEILQSEIPKLLTQYYGRKPTGLEIVTVLNRLALASFEPIGATTVRTHRTDYIGHEIDRFFRATKTAIPGIVTIGETMAHEMQLVFDRIEEDVYEVRTNDGAVLTGGAPIDPIHCCIRTDQWKGIDYVYPDL
jgi:hypothetical protein